MLDAVARRLSGSVRNRGQESENDEVPAGVARLGGDEFACAISGFDDIDVLSTIADRICEQLRKPVPYKGHEFVVEALEAILELARGSQLKVQKGRFEQLRAEIEQRLGFHIPDQ